MTDPNWRKLRRQVQAQRDQAERAHAANKGREVTMAYLTGWYLQASDTLEEMSRLTRQAKKEKKR